MLSDILTYISPSPSLSLQSRAVIGCWQVSNILYVCMDEFQFYSTYICILGELQGHQRFKFRFTRFFTSSSMAVAIHEVVDLDCHFSLPGTGTGSRAKPSVYPYMSLLASIAIIDMSSGSLELYTGSRF